MRGASFHTTWLTKSVTPREDSFSSMQLFARTHGVDAAKWILLTAIQNLIGDIRALKKE